MIDFTNQVESIKSKFTKDYLNVFNNIMEYDSLKLASMGANDKEGYQIFTPDFIVKDMCAAVGNDIFDYNKTVLEPTSGDGAFTTYILRKRLEKVYKNNDFELDFLKSLSTIYSIEMDKDLIIKQRNNIFTLIKQFVLEKKLEVSDSFYEVVKCIITTNFIWAMFNSDREIGGFLVEIAYKMPEAEKGKYKSLDFPVWSISKELIDVHYEEVDTW